MKKSLTSSSAIAFGALSYAVLFHAVSAEADQLCIKKRLKVSKGYVTLSGALKTTSTCPAGYSAVLDTTTFKGADGATGPSGAAGVDGSLRIYGDGSAGAASVLTNSSLNSANLQYTDFTVNSGVTLTVPSGTVIRCTGTFTNNGTINVGTFAAGGRHGTISSALYTVQSGSGHAGSSIAPSGDGGFGTDASNVYGGGEVGGLVEAQARQILKPGPAGGAGGGAGGLFGASGGGTVTVLCKGGIVNNGTISANGSSTFFTYGDGGGGGGIVILASQASVTNSATGVINVKGGNGSAAMASSGAGGGGGGGWTHFIAPVINSLGTITATGGTGGSNVTPVTAVPRFGGGCGGSSYGGGGLGAAVAASDASNLGGDGDPGAALQTLADPTSLF